MISTFWAAALPRQLFLCVAVATGIACTITAIPAAAYAPQSWNGYHWARTGALQLALGDNVSAAWKPFFTTAAQQWSAGNPNLSFAPTLGSTTAATCSAVYGTVQVCSANYGATGWLGYATVWTGGGGFINQATVKLNDYYFMQGTYNTNAWRAMTACQEIGHTFGLAHADVNRGNTNLGTCMDYTNDPTGTLGSNGSLANVAPSTSDFAALSTIYASVNTTQLSYTKPQYRIADGLYIGDDTDGNDVQAVPEPASWLMLIVGFGAVGGIMRRKAAPTTLGSTNAT